MKQTMIGPGYKDFSDIHIDGVEGRSNHQS